MTSFIHEDGLGNMIDEDGKDIIMMESDSHLLPVEMIMYYDQYMDLKPPERMAIMKTESDEEELNEPMTPNRKSYRYHKNVEKEELFFWCTRKVAGDQRDDPPKLVDEHQQFLIDLIDGNPSLVLDEIVTRLTEQFAGLNIKKSALHNFMTKKCKISLKRAHLQSVERNSPEKIEDRHAWVTKWLQTDMDYLSNCMFVDEAAFHVNMKRSALTTAILGAIFPFGVVNVSVRRPKAIAPSKKHKTTGSCRTVDKITSKRGTVIGHYFNFLSSTMDVLDKHKMFKDNYIVMDNSPIHQHEDIRKHVENRGYRCIYLPPYSPELNQIEQFWSICKSKLKREQLLEEETLTARIQMACNQILIGDLRGFCKYSTVKFVDCMSRRPI
ncbi:hypothetical protein G6F43_003288 [Rhizopus delemar]|nr:hypothetical protein G6F43_003288 [Rhizopus delemar]